MPGPHFRKRRTQLWATSIPTKGRAGLPITTEKNHLSRTKLRDPERSDLEPSRQFGIQRRGRHTAGGLLLRRQRRPHDVHPPILARSVSIVNRSRCKVYPCIHEYTCTYTCPTYPFRTQTLIMCILPYTFFSPVCTASSCGQLQLEGHKGNFNTGPKLELCHKHPCHGLSLKKPQTGPES